MAGFKLPSVRTLHRLGYLLGSMQDLEKSNHALYRDVLQHTWGTYARAREEKRLVDIETFLEKHYSKDLCFSGITLAHPNANLTQLLQLRKRWGRASQRVFGCYGDFAFRSLIPRSRRLFGKRSHVEEADEVGIRQCDDASSGGVASMQLQQVSQSRSHGHGHGGP